jgi:heptaprenyl diphosphate synthase
MQARTERPSPPQAGRESPSLGRGVADLTAFLGAFCFFLSALEYMVPKPLPFMRLGVANLPILLAVDILPLPWYLALALVKVVGMSLISGSLFSYVAVFSLAGTLTAALAMRAARKALGRLVSAVGVSVLGAVASNAVQIAIAGLFVFGDAARLVAPPFLATGLVTGVLLGAFADTFAAKSKWYERMCASLNKEAARG